MKQVFCYSHKLRKCIYQCPVFKGYRQFLRAIPLKSRRRGTWKNFLTPPENANNNSERHPLSNFGTHSPADLNLWDPTPFRFSGPPLSPFIHSSNDFKWNSLNTAGTELITAQTFNRSQSKKSSTLETLFWL